MFAQQQVKPGSGGRVCSSEAVITGSLGLGVAMASRNVSTPLFVSLPQPEFSGTVRARNGGQKPSPREVWQRLRTSVFHSHWEMFGRSNSIFCFPLGRMNSALDKHLARGRLHPGSPFSTLPTEPP